MNLAPSIQFYPGICSCPCICMFNLGISEGSLLASENQNSEKKKAAFGPVGSMSERVDHKPLSYYQSTWSQG